MGLHAVYGLINQSKFEDIFQLIKSLKGDERLEGQLLQAYILLEVRLEVDQALKIVETVLGQVQDKPALLSLARIQYAYIHFMKGKFKETDAELEQAQKLLSSLPAEKQVKVRHYQGLLKLVKGRSFAMQGNFDQAMHTLSQGLELAKKKTFPLKILPPIILCYMGAIDGLRDWNWDRVVSYFEKSLAAFKDLGNDLMQAFPISLLSTTYYFGEAVRDNSRAQDYSQKAFDLAQKGNYKFACWWALFILGKVTHSQGHLEQALAYRQQLLTLAKEIKFPIFIAWSLSDMGENYYALRNLMRAKGCFQQALKIYEAVAPRHPFIGSHMLMLGRIYWDLRDANTAEEYLQRCLTFWGEKDYRQAVALENLGNFYYVRGEIEKSETYLQHALAVYESTGYGQLETATIRIQYLLGYVYWAQGKFTRAEVVCRRVIKWAEEREEKDQTGFWSFPEGKTFLVQILLAQDRLDEAIVEVDQLEELAQTKKWPFFEVAHQLARGRLALKQYNLDLALRAAKTAKTLAATNSFTYSLIEAIKLVIHTQLQLYMVSNQEHHKNQLKSELQELSQLSKRENIHSAYIETLFLNGMLKRLDFDLPGAVQEFERVNLLATEQGLQAIAQQAQTEIHNLNTQAEFLQRMITQAPDAYRQMQSDAMASYLEQVRKIADLSEKET